MAQSPAELKEETHKQLKVDESKNEQQKEAQEVKESEKDNQEKQQAQSSTSGLFGSVTNGQNLFDNSKVKIAEGSSLFGGSLFGNGQPSTGLFTNSGSLFNNVDLTKPGPSLFGIQYQPQKSDESDGGEDDGQEEQKPEEDEPQQVIMKYDYTSNTEQLLKVNVEKFRLNTKEILEKGTIALEKSKQGDFYYFIYRNSIQQILYTGQLIKGVSVIKPLGQKAENVFLKAVNRKTEDKKDYTIDSLKVMFSNKEGVEQFKEQVAKLFE